ncbi:hypothetical protein TrRE_jg1224 [Triparma retinervis]|uniref:Protein-synthesizing GTPase n=1 Tax=Triparma retinervis TaxID=2557542 RepID=A0A9W6ZYE2_9STRA|nr:hypothetical protein TrRE_jg1224 [Triparma retinervis]
MAPITQDHLAKQDAANVDPKVLTPLSPEVISRQAHGKSTVVKAISGVQTVRFKNEMVRNITIKLGYANAKIYQGSRITVPGKTNDDGTVTPATSLAGPYTSRGSSHPDTFTEDGVTYNLRRHVSFVDCPGHDILMATMLNGAAVMDAAFLLFVAGTVADSAPVIPISAVLKYNIDIVCEYIVHKIPVPRRNFVSDPRLIVIRSFDVNKPGQDVKNLQGGVAGGSILQGILRVGDEVELRPGIVTKNDDGSVKCTPIYSRITSLYAEKNDLQFAVPGGLIGVGTKIDPTLTRADRLVGQVLGLKGRLPECFAEVEISYYLLRRLLGVKTSDGSKQAKVQKLSKTEILMVNIGSTATGGKVLAVKGDLAKILLTQPVCTQEGEKIALSRRVDKHWRLIGWGEIRKGVRIEI